jgi:hypothetical protein
VDFFIEAEGWQEAGGEELYLLHVGKGACVG